MLAPRKKLWSTPAAVAEVACDLLGLTSEDVLADFGCGDAVTLIVAAQRVNCRAIGWEIDERRAAQASARIATLGLTEKITIHTGNALEADPSGISAVFLYLIDRGLRMVLPLLSRIAACQPGKHTNRTTRPGPLPVSARILMPSAFQPEVIIMTSWLSLP